MRLALLALMWPCILAAQSFSGWSDVSPPRPSGSNFDLVVTDVRVHPLLPQKLIVAADGVYVSDDGGAHWSSSRWEGAGQVYLGPVDQLFVHPARPGTVFAQLEYTQRAFSAPWGGELFRSDDFGVTWQLVQRPLDAGQPVAAPYGSDPRNASVLYATQRSYDSFSYFYGQVIPSTNKSILKSADDGLTWHDVGPSFAGRPGFVSQAEGPRPASPDRLFFSTQDAVYVSYDGARSWQPFPSPAGTRWVRGTNLDANVLYAYRESGAPTSDEILRSDDGGTTWRTIFTITTRLPAPVTTGEPAVIPQIAIDPSDSRRLWLTGLAEGVFLSVDGGASWRNLGLAAEYAVCQACYPQRYLDAQTVARNLHFSAARPEVVYVVRGGHLLKGSLATSTRATIEYYVPSQDRYWVATNAGEAEAIDYGASGIDAMRTGESFRVFNAPADSLAGACRFQGNPAAGIHSRFLTIEGGECDAVKSLSAWVLEGENEYFVAPPAGGGQCGDGLVSVRRFFNQRADVNHRYVLNETVAAQMRAKDWRDEGISMCVPVRD